MAVDKREHTGFVDSTFDPSLKEVQNCTASSGNSSKVRYRFGISKSVIVDGGLWENPECPDDILWFISDEHFTATAPLEGEFDFGRETIEDNSKRVQTEAGQVTETKTLTFKGAHDSELVQAFRNIKIADQTGGYGTELMKAYSNGGFHLATDIEFTGENKGITEYALNVKLSTFPETMTQFDADSEIELEMLVEYDMFYEITGNFVDSLGLPESDLNLETNYTQSVSDVEITTTLTDTYEIVSANDFAQILVTAHNRSTSVKAVYSAKVASGENIIIPTASLGAEGDEISFIYHYFVGATLIAPAKQESFVIGTVTVPELTLTNTTASTPLGTSLTDEELITAFGATTSDGSTVIVNQATVDYNTAADYSIEFTSATITEPVIGTLTVQAARSTRKSKNA